MFVSQRDVSTLLMPKPTTANELNELEPFASISIVTASL
jgi:hypothetical protein